LGNLQLVRLTDIQQLEMIGLHPLGKFLHGNILASPRRTLVFMVVAGDTAEFFIIDQFLDIRIGSTHTAVGILLEFDEIECHIECVIQQQLANQRLTNAKQDLQSFGGLERANRARQNTQHATLRTRRDETRWRRLREETAITWSFLGIKDTYLSVKTID